MGLELGIYAVAAIAVIVAVAAFSQKLGIAAPIILVVVGVGLSYLPGVPFIEVPGELVLDAVLPPLLYAAAITVPITEFRRNAAPIVSLSVLLVIATAFGAGFFLYAVLPDLNLGAAIALGAIISPPDAVAATSIGRRLGLPSRLLALLEGEGLLNDATALVLLRSALAAAAGTLATPWNAVGDFLLSVAVAVAIGLIVGVVTVFIRSRLSDSVLDTAISLAVPFVAFMPAEALGASGVLSVVVAGLYTGHSRSRALTAQARITERTNWRTIQFLLENGVFLLIGIEIRTLINDIDPKVLGLGDAIAIGLVATLAVVVIRYLWVGPLLLGMGAVARRAERRMLREYLVIHHFRNHPVTNVLQRRRKAQLERRFERDRADLEHHRQQQVGWRGGVVLGWTGMRGVVTLAAAQSLPMDPDVIPYRPQLVLIAFTVAVVSLVLQGGTLPLLIRLLKLRDNDTAAHQEDLARLLDELSQAGMGVLDEPETTIGVESPIDPEVIERARQSSYLRAEAVWERARSQNLATSDQPHLLYRALRLAMVEAEREKLLEERRKGAYSTRALDDAQAMLDLEESRLRLRGGGLPR
jgi:CPA1 family monovalent cation:H+ antiporter